ncbi:MAG: HD domain-containing protein [Planctomycetota bacterium]|nr:HD domain-containing protein [Planctomycetota bacterium]
MSQKVARASVLAMQCHEGQKRQFSDDPYFFHVIRVAALVGAHPDMGEDEVCAAVLHDTLEDSDLPPKDIAEQFGDKVLALVDQLTNRFTSSAYPNESREWRKNRERARLASCSRTARIMKMLDRMDNVSETLFRLQNDTTVTQKFCERYLDETESMLEAIGDADRRIAGQLHELVEQTRDAARKAFRN